MKIEKINTAHLRNDEVIVRHKRKHHHHHGLNQNSQNLQNGQNSQQGGK